MRSRPTGVTLVLLVVAWAGTADAKKKRKPKAAPPPAAAAAPSAPALESKPSAAVLENAIQLYQSARFGESIGVLDRVFRQTTDPGTKKQAKLYLGMNFLSLGNEPRAEQMFRELLDLDPDFELPTFSSPSTRQFFARTKSAYKIIPVPLHTPPADIDATIGADLRITVQRMRPSYQAALYYRAQGDAKYSRMDLSHVSGDAFVAKLPPALLVRDKGYSLEYYVVITEGQSTVLAELRTQTNPFTVPVAVPVELAGTPAYKKWWLWTVIGGVVLAGAAAAIVVVVVTHVPPTGQATVRFEF